MIAFSVRAVCHSPIVLPDCVNARTAVRANLWLIRERVPQVDDGEKELRLARLEALAAAVERWLADPRYVTEQMMIKALRELERRL
jgi:hypothetical protein